MRYRTKPFTIEAVQWTGKNMLDVVDTFSDVEISEDISALSDGRVLHVVKVYDYLQDTWVEVNKGDYIIRGMKGEYYPCDPDVFEAKYQPEKEAPELNNPLEIETVKYEL